MQGRVTAIDVDAPGVGRSRKAELNGAKPPSVFGVQPGEGRRKEVRRAMTGLLRWWSRSDSDNASDAAASRDGWHVRVPLPGIAPEDIDVTIAGRVLHVRAHAIDGDTSVMRYEDMMMLPDEVDTNKIAASFRHGMLELTLPEKEDTKPRRIEISTTDVKPQSTAA
jgi:HSP20 family protein